MAFTWLNKIGHDIVTIFHKASPVVAELQAVATPFENAFAPGLSQVINISLSTIAQTEALAEAAGAASGSGAVKLAAVTAAVAPQIAPILKSFGVTNPTSAQYNKFINALVEAANTFQIQQPPPVAINTNAAASTVAAGTPLQ
jgi:hypothetical protein